MPVVTHRFTLPSPEKAKELQAALHKACSDISTFRDGRVLYVFDAHEPTQGSAIRKLADEAEYS